jgi:hypothetical protein
MITVAKGRCTSELIPWDSAIGSNPNIANRALDRFERPEKQDKNEEHAHGDNEKQAAHRSLPILKLTTKCYRVALREAPGSSALPASSLGPGCPYRDP